MSSQIPVDVPWDKLLAEYRLHRRSSNEELASNVVIHGEHHCGRHDFRLVYGQARVTRIMEMHPR